jgi:protein transport protein SEC61 subunit gamma-like protein
MFEEAAATRISLFLTKLMGADTKKANKGKTNAMELNKENLEKKVSKARNAVKSRIREYQRVLKISEKPDREEFETSAKITGLGILLIGVIGFLFYLAANLIPNYI